MKKNIYILLAMTILSFSLTLININYLSPFAITNTDEAFSILARTWKILNTDSSEKYWLIGYVLSAIISSGSSIIIILKLRDIGKTEVPEHSRVVKSIFIFWLGLLSINILLSFYYLLFVFLGLLIAIMMILLILGVAAGQGKGGGSVHVRGHYRRGAYVRSHCRSRPRR